MLPRAQVILLVERGRELTSDIEALLSKHEVLRMKEQDAFSVGEIAELQQFRKDREALEEEALRKRVELSSVLQELAGYAADCLNDYQQEVTAQGGLPAALSVPNNAAPDRIQEYRRYFHEIQQAVNDITSYLTEFRRQQLSSTIEELRRLLERLKTFGEELGTIEEYLDQGTYLDLPLTDARKRLQDEKTLIEQRLAEQERQRRERERQQLLTQARAALDRLSSREAIDANTWVDDLNLAVTLLQHGTSEDSRYFWQAVGGLLRAVQPGAQDQLVRLTKESLLERCLDPSNEELPFELLDEMGPEPLRNLDHRLAADSPWVHSLTVGHRSRGTLEELIIGRLCRLKERLPAASLAILRMLEEDHHLSIRDLAIWFLSPPLQWLDYEQGIEWFARTLEKRDAWREAYACWGVVSLEEAIPRRFAALLIAIADNVRLVPTSEQVWWEVLSTKPGAFASDLTVTVAATATLLLGYKAEFDIRDLLSSCIKALGTRSQMRAALELAVRTWPQPLASSFAQVDACLREQKELLNKITGFLETARTPAGLPAREFYRDILLPKLKEAFHEGGARALKEIEPNLVRRLLEDHGLVSINPVAVQVMERRVQELQELGAQLAEAEAHYMQLPASTSSSELIDSLVHEFEAIANQDPSLRWAYSRVQEAIQGTGPVKATPEFIKFSSSSLVSVLFHDNPVVEIVGDRTPDAEQLFTSFLEELCNGDNLADWRVRYAVEHLAFDVAARYCAGVSPPNQSLLQEYISRSWSAASKETADLLELAKQYVDTLEPCEDIDITRLYLEEAKLAIERRELVSARKSVQAVVTECDRIEKMQREERDRIITETGEALVRGFELLCLKGSGASAELVALLVSTIYEAHSSGPREVSKLGAAITSLLAGRSFDRSLVTIAFNIVALGKELPTPPEEAVQHAPGSTIPIPERSPIELDKLPRLVQVEIEQIAQKPAETFDRREAWDAIAMGTSGPQRIRAAVELFRAERKENSRWEEPLVAFLEERGHEAWKEANYLRAAEYYLAATQVAYSASARLDRGIDAARRASLNYALAKLMRLQASSGLKPTTTRPIFGVSSRDWVNAIREYLLLRGGAELIEVLDTLLQIAPDLAHEYLELPLSEISALHSTLIRALLEKLDSMSPSRYALLEFISTYGLSADDYTAMEKFLSQLRDAARQVVERQFRTSVIPLSRAIEELEIAIEEIPLAEQVRQLFKETINRMRLEEDFVSNSEGAEANIAALTREIFLDAFEVAEDISIHIRMSITPQSAILRDITISLRSEHPNLEVSRTWRTLELARLRGGDPIELTCYVCRRTSQADSSSRSTQFSSEFILEVNNIGVRQGGVIKAGAVPYKGRRLTIQVRPTYPHSSRPNPYSPGPAIKELSLIKGRDEEVRNILRHLRGGYHPS